MSYLARVSVLLLLTVGVAAHGWAAGPVTSQLLTLLPMIVLARWLERDPSGPSNSLAMLAAVGTGLVFDCVTGGPLGQWAALYLVGSSTISYAQIALPLGRARAGAADITAPLAYIPAALGLTAVTGLQVVLGIIYWQQPVAIWPLVLGAWWAMVIAIGWAVWDAITARLSAGLRHWRTGPTLAQRHRRWQAGGKVEIGR